ncbi:14116_t:CDS:2 [Entrophospora sp. SA101]|nr:14116_t:CDS:2 [Entrophospora sp. SA101]
MAINVVIAATNLYLIYVKVPVLFEFSGDDDLEDPMQYRNLLVLVYGLPGHLTMLYQ